MSKSPICRIKALLGALPERDSVLALSFVESRDYESLRDLVHSVIYMTERAQGSLEFQRCKNLNLTNLETLYFEVDTYVSLLYGLEDDVDCMEFELGDIEVEEYNDETLY